MKRQLKAFMAYRWREILQQYNTRLCRDIFNSHTNIPNLIMSVWKAFYGVQRNMCMSVYMCVHLCKCVWQRETVNVLLWLWCCWQRGDIWNLGIRFVFEKNNIQTISVLYSNVVSVTHPLCSLTGVFLHLYSIMCQRCSRLQSQRKPIPHVITDAVTGTVCRQHRYFLYFFMRVNMTFLVHSQRGAA